MGSKVFSSLSDVANIIDSLHKTPKYSEVGYPMVRCVNISYGPLKLTQTKKVTAEIFHEYSKKYRPHEGDIIITRVGANFGETAYVEDTNFCLGQNTAAIKPTSIAPEYLYFILNSAVCRHQMDVLATGAAQPTLSIKSIKSLQIPRLGGEIEKKIANIYSELNNKITLNRQINQTLEQMAQTLFKSWFVDFDPVVDNALDAGFFEQDLGFSEELLHRVEVRKAVRESDNFKPLSEDIRRLFPDAFEECAEPVLGLGGWVPKRWQISTVDDELTVKGGSTPSTANPDFWEQGNIHWTSPKDLSGSQEKIMLDTERKITELGLRKITSGLLPINTVLMSSRAPIGYLAMAKIPVAINQGYIAITTTKRLSQEYVLYWLDSSMDEIKGIAGGTTFAEISKKTFKSISMVIPDPQVIEKYTVTIKSYLNKVTLNAKERGSLEKLRDTLLPKLISGELSLSDIKIDIPEETLI
ncbi:restriction endonuclease subunit S [Proteus mirabilis]